MANFECDCSPENDGEKNQFGMCFNGSIKNVTCIFDQLFVGFCWKKNYFYNVINK